MRGKILQFKEPSEGEPICSGPEMILQAGNPIHLAHFHTVVKVEVSDRKPLFAPRDTVTLKCTVSINGNKLEERTFNISNDDIGKTLFCAGFPCITVTGAAEEDAQLVITQSEIVELCSPDYCPWGDHSHN